MNRLSRSILGLVCTATVVSACQEGIPGRAAATMAVGLHGSQAAGAETLVVRLRTGQRVLATSSDIHRLSFQVRTQDGTTRYQWLDASALSNQQASATFTGLPAGRAFVIVRALDAQGQVLGEEEAIATIAPGQTTDVEMNLRLAGDESSAQPPAATVGLSAEVTVLDGPTTPDALPRLNHPVDYWEDGNEYIVTFHVDRHGDVHLRNWADELKIVSSTSLTGGSWTMGAAPTHFTEAIDARGRTYGYTNSKLFQLGVGGMVLKNWALPKNNVRKFIAPDDTGNVWVTGGNVVTKISDAGDVVGSFDLGSPTGIVVLNPATHEAWVGSARQAKVMRLAPDGQVLNTVVSGQPGDLIADMALDSGGNLWVLHQYGGSLTKIGPDGRIKGTTRVGNHLLHLVIDPFDNIWMADTTREGLVKMDSSGRMLGYVEVEPMLYPEEQAFRLEIDRKGNLIVPLRGGVDLGTMNGFAVVRTLQ